MSGPELHPAELIAWIGMFPKQLRVLTIKDQCIGIFDIIALLKELPLLESLKCRFDESSMEQEDFASQLGELQAASVPLNTSFKRWIPFKNGWELRGRFDQCAEILAGLCPNFSYGETGQTSGAPASAQRASSELEDGEFSIYSLL
ncbi:hypothetical protein IWQ57_001649 [Coemansia nantahalensis]|uniref:Uncharacterized protein n=1 Tax=Coemansia nantahalensis TaxID=2789366 RepID=A0ACC1K3L7_9FUNG|nr:hypothetical protein IWQ57_001649 [Coemansia nantahalensis]